MLGREEEAKKWADLAERAEIALAGKPEDVLDVVEEIEIPKLTERPKFDPATKARPPFERKQFENRGTGKSNRGFDGPGKTGRSAPRGR